MAKNASGCGSLRKKTVRKGDKEYTYWEARYTAGYHPGTGKQIQRSITGKTQREVTQKLKAATASIDAGTYIAPSKLTLGNWMDTGFVFTNELGEHLKPWTLYRAFKRAATEIGRSDARFHDLRHSYAVAAIRSSDDIKTIHGNLGHATASFTLDVYGHVTDQMKQASAQRMQEYIKGIVD